MKYLLLILNFASSAFAGDISYTFNESNGGLPSDANVTQSSNHGSQASITCAPTDTGDAVGIMIDRQVVIPRTPIDHALCIGIAELARKGNFTSMTF